MVQTLYSAIHRISVKVYSRGGGGVLPYKGLTGTRGQPGYVFWYFYLKQGIDFLVFLS